MEQYYPQLDISTMVLVLASQRKRCTWDDVADIKLTARNIYGGYRWLGWGHEREREREREREIELSNFPSQQNGMHP